MEEKTPQSIEGESGSGAVQNDQASDSSPLRKIEIPSITLPKGGGAIKGIDEKFEVNAVNASANFSIPFPTPSARGFSASLGISYNSGGGNSIFGIGWSLSLPSIRRKTEKELPQYFDSTDSDTYLFSGVEDLVPKLIPVAGGWVPHEVDSPDNLYRIKYYRPRIEGGFARIERWTRKADGFIHWKVISSDNTTRFFGSDSGSRITDPSDPGKTFEWFLRFCHDDKGNCSLYDHAPEDSSGIDAQSLHNKNRTNGNALFVNTYLKRIRSGNITPYRSGDPFPPASQFLFETVLDYGEHDKLNEPFAAIQPWTFRQDAFSEYRAGFETRTCRLCQRVLLYHHFAELPGGSALIRSLDFTYDNNGQIGNFNFLKEVISKGYTKHDDGTYTKKEIPPLTFIYQQHEWNKEIKNISDESLSHLPTGIYEPSYQWVDLYSEGLNGILSEQGTGLYYKQNNGNGNFAAAKLISPRPSFMGIGSQLQLQELEADGVKYLSSYEGINSGYFKINDEAEWQSFRPFEQLPNVSFNDANTRLLDLNGDGRAEALITEDNVFTWYPSLGEKGFADSSRVWKSIDEEKGPALVFKNQEQSIFLSDMSGDGLTDIVRIRNGSVCYWPNLGYGKFGAKVTMDHAPIFDHPDQFNASLIKLADVDGSGTTDIIYLGKSQFKVWLNQSGNSFLANPEEIDPFYEITNLCQVSVIDFLGNGTSCIVWSSNQPKDQFRPLRYIDLMNGKKPHLMVAYKNNMGKEVELEYAASTHYYIQDKVEGNPWVTKLPFPVHCLSKVVTYDRIMKTRFANEYSYHHGYYDHVEREFRGFGRIDQKDAEEIAHFTRQSSGALNNVVQEDLHQPPVMTKTWFHTGAFIDQEKIINQFVHEYSQNPVHPENLLPEPQLPDGLSLDEWRQALRACKSMVLRKEVYALDGTTASDNPYSVEQQNCLIQLIQPKGGNKYASFMVLNSETISYQYERDLSDPSIAHSLTLEADSFGNVKKSASLVYARKPPGGGLPPHAPEQLKIYVTFTENDFTPPMDTATNYRTPVLYQTKLFEGTGLPTPAGNYYTLKEVKNAHAAAAFIDFDITPNGTLQKRLVDWSRSQFRGDNGASVLPFGIMESKSLVHQNFKAAFNQTQLTNVFSGKIALANLSAVLLDPAKGGYVQADNYFWVPSASPQYDTTNFYQQVSFSDAFGNVTQVQYDSAYHLFAQKTIDPLNNETTVTKFNYRVLQPYQILDINENLSAVRFDEHGIPVKLFSIGKKGIDPGDAFDDTVTEMPANDFPYSELEYQVFEWFNLSTAAGFDISNYKPKPNYIKTTIRETHYHADPLHQTKIQESYTYCNGAGKEVLKKIQAEPGRAIQVNADGTTTVILDTSPSLRWVGNGRTILNNKGNPVKQYEPYFSVGPTFDDEKELVELGVTPIFEYDPLGRVIKTIFTAGTSSKVEFTPWLQKTFDQNDTVLQSDWYDSRITNPDPAIATPEEIMAAQKASLHNNTPTIAYLDTLGRTFLTEADNVTEKIASHLRLDIEGKQLEVTDGLNRVVMQYDYDLLGRNIKQISLDAGTRWTIMDAGENPLLTWDELGHEFSFEYDSLRRPVTSFIKTGTGPTIAFGKTEYGESLAPAAAKANNLRGTACKAFDQSGVLVTITNDFKGNLLSSTRQLASDYKNMIDWTNIPAVALEGEIFTSSTTYDALSRPLQIVPPHSAVMAVSEVYPGYNEAGLLDKVGVKIRGAAGVTPFVTNINYDAKGQREEIVYGNGTKTTYQYDKNTFRLVHLKTTRNSGPPVLQDLKYTYDPVGNLVRIKDDAHADTFFDGEQVQALNEYTYDAVYRLTLATGRKHAGQTDIQSKATLAGNAGFRDHPFIPSGTISPNDGNAFRKYSETFLYDKAGNLQAQKHLAKNSNWTRTFEYENNSNLTNRMTKTTIHGEDYLYTYDAHGNMYGLETVANEVWNFMDKFKEANLGGGGSVYYVYDGGGERVRKVIERLGGLTQERIYLGGFEIYRQKNNGGAITLERETLHVMDDARRIAMIDTPTVKPAGSSETQLIRFQYDNHLGSASYELDDLAQVISYEEYFPYGTTSFSTIDSTREVPARRYRYTAKERDEESGLSYHGARYYATWLGRWNAADPVGIRAGLNVYTYVSGNPVIRTDPGGTDEKPPSTITAPTRFIFDPQMASRVTLFNTGSSYGARFAGRLRIMEREHFLVSTLPGQEPQSFTGSAYLNLAQASFSTSDYSLSLSAELELEENFLDVKSWPSDISLQARITPTFSLQKGTLQLLNINASAGSTFLSASFSGQLRLSAPNQTLSTYTQMANDLILSLRSGSDFLGLASQYALNTFGLGLDFTSTVRFLGIPITHAWGQFGQDTDINAIGFLPVPAGTLFDVSALVIGGYKSHSGTGVDWNVQGGVLPLLSPSAISAGEPPARMFPTYLYGKVELSLGQLTLGPVALQNIRTGVEGSASLADLGGTESTVLTEEQRFNQMYDAIRGAGEEQLAPLRGSLFLRGEF